jgi:hypothetical protein
VVESVLKLDLNDGAVGSRSRGVAGWNSPKNLNAQVTTFLHLGTSNDTCRLLHL